MRTSNEAPVPGAEGMTKPEPIRRPRVARFKVPVRFDGARAARVTIDRDSNIMTIRLERRRATLALALGVVVESLLWREVKRKAAEHEKAKRERRRARRASR